MICYRSCAISQHRQPQSRREIDLSQRPNLWYDKSEEPRDNNGVPSRCLYERLFLRIVGEEYGVGWAGVEEFNDGGEQEGNGGEWKKGSWGGEDNTDRAVGDVHQLVPYINVAMNQEAGSIPNLACLVIQH